MPRPAFYLASSSPRRRALLRQCGIEPVVVAQRAPEPTCPGESAEDHVLRLALAKAEDALARLEPGVTAAHPGVLLAADTTVEIDGLRLEKPADHDEARRMLARLAGRTHTVWTGVHLVRVPGGSRCGGAVATTVHFRDLDARTVDAYVASGEPLDKAGAYGIQGLGVLLVDRIDGSWTNVVGLPLERLAGWLAELGLHLADLAFGAGCDGQDDAANSS